MKQFLFSTPTLCRHAPAHGTMLHIIIRRRAARGKRLFCMAVENISVRCAVECVVALVALRNDGGGSQGNIGSGIKIQRLDGLSADIERFDG